MKRVLVLISCLVLMSPLAYANEAPMKINAGLWEGINDSSGLDYSLLQINENGKHALFIANFQSAFRKVKRLAFTNNDIACTLSECTVTITSPNTNRRSRRLILAPTLKSTDSFSVLDIALVNKKPTITQSYQLDKKQGPSTIREFIQRYANTLKSQQSETYVNDGINGFWVGVIDYHDKKQLVVLNVQQNKKSEFVYFSNGSNTVIDATFNNNDIMFNSDKDTPYITIATSHPTFANKIMLHQHSKDILSGHVYSYHKEQVLEVAGFELTRVNLGER